MLLASASVSVTATVLENPPQPQQPEPSDNSMPSIVASPLTAPVSVPFSTLNIYVPPTSKEIFYRETKEADVQITSNRATVIIKDQFKLTEGFPIIIPIMINKIENVAVRISDTFDLIISLPKDFNTSKDKNMDLILKKVKADSSLLPKLKSNQVLADNSIYSIEFNQDGTPLETLPKPFLLSIKYGNFNFDSKSVGLYHTKYGLYDWSAVPGYINDTKNKIVFALIDHVTYFTAIGTPLSPKVGSVSEKDEEKKDSELAQIPESITPRLEVIKPTTEIIKNIKSELDENKEIKIIQDGTLKIPAKDKGTTTDDASKNLPKKKTLIESVRALTVPISILFLIPFLWLIL
ncbi:MAG: hypothetical protein UT05_C0008G0005 [Parcubacteria group bacterium GW2011_GWF2_38_76]|nr:MAG: hypothetical protein UT05_C0008G0005 [Parcubacteria group bacterium GW2011_GWF2_38_76]